MMNADLHYFSPMYILFKIVIINSLMLLINFIR